MTALGRVVTEVGIRQAWPFLTLCEPGGDAEIRLYLDTTFILGPGPTVSADDDVLAVTALLDLNGRTVTEAEVGATGELSLRFDGERDLVVTGEAAAFTTHVPWWFTGVT